MNKYQFKGKVWRFRGKGGWYFISIPKLISKKIRKLEGLSEEGWGRLKTTAQIGNTSWETAVWFDTKIEAYLLPLKLAVRKLEGLEEESSVKVSLRFIKTDPKRASWLVKP